MAIRFLARQTIVQPIMVAVRQQTQVSPWRARLSWLMLGLTVLLVVAGLPFWTAFHDWLIAFYELPYSAGVSMLITAVDSVAMLALALLGTLIVFAQPGNRIGWLLSGFVLMVSLVALCEKYAVYAYVIYPDRELPLRQPALWVQNWAWIPGVALPTIALPLLFPDGHLLSRWWQWFGAWAIGVIGFLTFAMAFHPDAPLANYFLDIEHDLSNPYGIAALPAVIALLINPLWGLSLLTMLVAWLSLAVRYRRADHTTRQQIKWFVFGLGFVIILFVVRNFSRYAPASILEIAFQLSLFILPITLGISILKYRLYDIDIIINRTLVYGSLTVSVAGMYVLIVGSLGTLFQSSGQLLISLVATGTVAALFQPLRERLQRAANYLMFGERDDPVGVLTRLGQRLEVAIAPDAVLTMIAETVAEALRLPYTAIELREEDRFITGAVYGRLAYEPIYLPLIYQAETIGRLVVTPRDSGEPFGSADQVLLESIARQAATAVQAAQLAADLQRSRQRLVTTREEERRRLRRDLHDGLGPALAAYRLKIGSVRALLDRNLSAADTMLAEIETDLETAIIDIRRLIYNLRPPALDELGLVAAIREYANQYRLQRTEQNTPGTGSELTILVNAPDDVPTLPAAIEVAAYRIVQEALTNVVRHAHARTCQINLALTDALDLTIIDDGVGMPRNRRLGVGLTSMWERAAELDGTCMIEDGPGGGTRVHARLPLPKDTLWTQFEF